MIDINNRKKIYNILNKFKPDGIFNLAAETHVDRSIDDAKDFVHSNILGVYNILEALKDYQGRIKVTLVPNLTNICYGRGVGYKIEEIVLSEEIQKISATNIRKKMREKGELK